MILKKSLRRNPHTPRAKKYVQPSRKKTGNPNWGKPNNQLPVPYVPTTFDKFVESHGLIPSAYGTSPELRKWASKNFRVRYVPESLLEMWGLELDFEL